MKRLWGLCLVCLLAIGCLKKPLVIVTHAASETCDFVQVLTADGLVRAICLGVEALDRLLDALQAAEGQSVGVLLIVKHGDGTEERIEVARGAVASLSAQVGAMKAQRR